MNKQTEALKMAIEVMQAFDSQLPTNSAKKAIQACKEALQHQEEYVLICKRCGDDLGIKYVEQPSQEPVAFDCKNCHACLKGVKGETGYPITMTRMIVCPDCGNKRCPKATDHRHFCTNSNDTNQAGSIYNTHPAPSWQGLSDDEILNLIHEYAAEGDVTFVRAIEQELKRKNCFNDIKEKNHG